MVAAAAAALKQGTPSWASRARWRSTTARGNYSWRMIVSGTSISPNTMCAVLLIGVQVLGRQSCTHPATPASWLMPVCSSRTSSSRRTSLYTGTKSPSEQRQQLSDTQAQQALVAAQGAGGGRRFGVADGPCPCGRHGAAERHAAAGGHTVSRELPPLHLCNRQRASPTSFM